MAVNNLRKLAHRFVEILTFKHIKLRRKFLLFTVGVAVWFWILAGLGLTFGATTRGVLSLGIALVVAHALLVLFSVTFTRSVAGPIDEMIEQVHALSDGVLGPRRHLTVMTGDEVGDLTQHINVLLDVLGEINTFKKVIEEDTTLDDVYHRLGTAFRARALDDHRVMTVTRDRRGLLTVLGDDGSSGWCGTVIEGDPGQCRAIKSGGPVTSSTYPGICKQFIAVGAGHVCVPLILGGATEGVATFLARDPGAMTSLDARVESASRFIKEALPVIEARRLAETLRDSALRDPMTLAYNRRYVEETQAALVALVKRRGSSLGVLMCDIDFFKKVNDTHGHAAGDVVLKDFVSIINEVVRASDTVIRYGGEEFVVLLHDTDLAGTVRVAERLRTAVEGHAFATSTGEIHATVSIGAATFPAHGQTLWQAVASADAALYRAKTEGRNRVIAADGRDATVTTPAPTTSMPAST